METGKGKILIIEDDTTLLDAIATTLSHEGFEVSTADDGEKGLEKALNEKPHLILLDIMLPKMDGLAVLGKLRKDVWGAEAKVIVLTALDDLNKIAEVIEAGGTEYIVKTNITLNEIVQKIKEKMGT